MSIAIKNKREKKIQHFNGLTLAGSDFKEILNTILIAYLQKEALTELL